MNNLTDATHDTRIASIVANPRVLSYIQARRPTVALAQNAFISPPTSARIRDTKMKNRPDQVACSSILATGAPSRRRASLPSLEADNVRQRSSLRRASPERRRSLTGISWNKDIEAVCIIPARAPEQDPFMALVQCPPLLRPSSASPFDVTATAAGAAAASRAGVKLAMANSFKLRNP